MYVGNVIDFMVYNVIGLYLRKLRNFVGYVYIMASIFIYRYIYVYTSSYIQRVYMCMYLIVNIKISTFVNIFVILYGNVIQSISISISCWLATSTTKHMI